MAESRKPEEKLWGQRGHGKSTYTNENSRDRAALEGRREEVETTSGESFEA